MISASTGELISRKSPGHDRRPISISISRWISVSLTPVVVSICVARWRVQSAMPAPSHSGTTKYKRNRRVIARVSSSDKWVSSSDKWVSSSDKWVSSATGAGGRRIVRAPSASARIEADPNSNAFIGDSDL